MLKSSINRWGFNAVQAFEYCILLKACFHCDGSVTFWVGSKFSISFWFGSKNCLPVHYWNWRVTQNIKFKIKLFLLKHLFQEVPVWYLLTSANCKIAVSGTFYVELLKSFWSDAGSGPEDKSYCKADTDHANDSIPDLTHLPFLKNKFFSNLLRYTP